MGKVATSRAAKQSALQKSNEDDIIQEAGDFLGTIAIAQHLPVDFVGVSISILKEPKTNRLQAVILSPVDMHGDEPFARYKVEPDHVAAVKPRQLIVPS